jgi:uncharacterized integral membrane protein
MQAVRIIAWVALLVAAILFATNNWTAVEVMIWDGIVLETKIPALMLLSFLLGFLPMWLLNHGTRWRLHRRIRSLENAAQSVSSVLSPPVATEPDLTDNKPEQP